MSHNILEKILYKYYLIDHRINLIYTNYPEKIYGIKSELFFDWLGWVATDGDLPKNNNAIVINQYKDCNKPIIKELMNKAFPLYGWLETENRFSINDKDLKKLRD